jgi:enoyl-CoA hydratase/carnithine racemase
MEMLLLGDYMSAQRAYEIGLVNRVATNEDIDNVTNELATEIAAKSAPTLKIGKHAFQEQLDRELKLAYDYCNQVMVENMMADHAEEGIEAFLEKRPPRWGHEA